MLFRFLLILLGAGTFQALSSAEPPYSPRQDVLNGVEPGVSQHLWELQNKRSNYITPLPDLNPSYLIPRENFLPGNDVPRESMPLEIDLPAEEQSTPRADSPAPAPRPEERAASSNYLGIILGGLVGITLLLGMSLIRKK